VTNGLGSWPARQKSKIRRIIKGFSKLLGKLFGKEQDRGFAQKGAGQRVRSKFDTPVAASKL
jgi:hypothetical protein